MELTTRKSPLPYFSLGYKDRSWT